MRTFKNLYSRITDFQNLVKAAKLAQRGKRFKNTTAFFNLRLEKELWRLQAELKDKTYIPGAYRDFLIYEPKKRMISAAPYRDRVVHHAIHNVLAPIFDPTFIYDSYATRKGKGTHAGIDRFQSFARKCPYVLKCDIKKYFPNIDHAVLMELIRHKVACRDTLWLIGKIMGSHINLAESLQSVRPSVRPSVRSIGIPIGNLTSQFFANIYLNGLDHFIKEKLGCRYYLRYMDDFVVFHSNKEFLRHVKTEIEKYLKDLHLVLHEGKCHIFKSEKGIPFLGLIVFPNRRRLKRGNVIRFKRRLKRLQRLCQKDRTGWRQALRSIRAWIGHAGHADTYTLRKLVLEEAVF